MSEHPATIPPKPALLNAALLILRLACAAAFLYHGSAILFGAFRGPGPERFSAFMHMPRAIGYLVGLRSSPAAWQCYLASSSGWLRPALSSSCLEPSSWYTCRTVLM